MAELLPLFLDLAGRRVVLVGGGSVATGKLRQLLAADADVLVVAPAVTAEIRASGVAVRVRCFRPSDLDRAWLAVAAATPAVNAAVAQAAHARRLLVNAVDDPRHASAFMGAVLRRGAVTVAVSTGGRAPALAALMRDGIESLIPDDVERWVAEADARRIEWKGLGTAMSHRKPLLLEGINRLYE